MCSVCAPMKKFTKSIGNHNVDLCRPERASVTRPRRQGADWLARKYKQNKNDDAFEALAQWEDAARLPSRRCSMHSSFSHLSAIKNAISTNNNSNN